MLPPFAVDESWVELMARELPNSATFIVDHDMTYRLALGGALARLEISPEAFAGKRVRDMVPPAEVEVAEAGYRRALAGESWVAEHSIDGRTFETRGIPLRDGEGRVVAALATSYDVSERRAATNALAESEARFRAMADGAPVLIWVTDIRGHLEFVNRAFCELLGTSVQAAKTSGWQQCVHPDDLASFTSAYEHALLQQQEFRAELRVRAADGSWRWLESIATPRFDGLKKFAGLLGNSTDTTRRKSFEDNAQHAIRDHELMIGVLSHDLRDSLAAVVTGAELARRRPERAATALERVIASAQRMNRMVTHLLDLTRLRNGDGLPIYPVHTDATALAQTVLGELEHVHPTRLIRFAGVGSTIGSWDPDRIFQLLSNIIGNAAIHASRDAAVDVIIDGTGANEVVITTRNEGAIPAHVRATLFEPFRRGGGRGLGLGLYIASEIAHAHGGDIRANFQRNDETVIEVRLPRVAGKPTT